MPNNDLISKNDLLFEISTKATVYDGSRIGEGIGILLDRSEVLGGIEAAPAVDAEPVRHGEWKHIKKHLWHKDEKGEIDMYYLDFGFHNGPGCEICGECICANCEPDWAEKECRIGYYVCSECEQPTKTGESNYCPNCGAKLENPK